MCTGVYFFFVCVCLCTTCIPGTLGGQKRTPDSPELELQTVMSDRVGDLCPLSEHPVPLAAELSVAPAPTIPLLKNLTKIPCSKTVKGSSMAIYSTMVRVCFYPSTLKDLSLWWPLFLLQCLRLGV